MKAALKHNRMALGVEMEAERFESIKCELADISLICNQK